MPIVHKADAGAIPIETMNPLTTFQERYPLADFSVYFRHLEACRTEKGLNTQDHHICPRAQFPEYAEGFPENLITLIIDDHYFAHKLLEAACGIKSPSSVLLETARKGASKGGLGNRGKQKTAEHRHNIRKANAHNLTRLNLLNQSRTFSERASRQRRAAAMEAVLQEKRQAIAERRFPRFTNYMQVLSKQ